MSNPQGEAALRDEFGRAAAAFAERTRGRFDDLDVVSFADLPRGATIVEVGAGTGNFLSLFAGTAGRLIAVDLTIAMLREARAAYPHMHLVAGDARRLPLRSRSVDVACSAQMLHHVSDPLSVVREMRRVVRHEGKVLIVDQVATERFEEATAMTALELVRDPSHVASRPPSALRTIVQAAGLDVVAERIISSRQRFSQWMWRGEFPDERIAAVREHIERHGADTGMDFSRDGDEWTFERRRIMLLARRSPAA